MIVEFAMHIAWGIEALEDMLSARMSACKTLTAHVKHDCKFLDYFYYCWKWTNQRNCRGLGACTLLVVKRRWIPHLHHTCLHSFHRCTAAYFYKQRSTCHRLLIGIKHDTFTSPTNFDLMFCPKGCVAVRCIAFRCTHRIRCHLAVLTYHNHYQ